ncbi:MAG: ankyrin repeat domain-containing protein [Opitutae bacterium]|nr:ankyrin repeat domain-containing protein [Opitutae bacterium]
MRQFVAAAHGDLPMTQAMLAAQPHLLNATWDWGNGDFETALGGASHMGRRDIALFLLEHGARPDLFAMTMLGYLDVVKALLAARPDALKCPGPHGIPLIVHAEKGGAEALPVLEFLRQLPAA